MKPNKGRTGRRRRRKRVEASAVNQSCDVRYVRLRKWLKDRGFRDSQLRTAHFPDTGRGLMTTCLLQVEAAFNEENGRYEIRTNVRYKKYDQVFICYGPHDNQRLLLEYGFVAANNPHRSVYVTRDVILQYLSSTDKQLQKKWSLLKENGFLENLTFGQDRPSWKLVTALRLLCLGSEEFTCWKNVLLGSLVSESSERSCMELVRGICRHLLQQSSCTLHKISALKNEHTANPHLALVESLRMEELGILQSSGDLLQNTDLLSL